MKQDERTHRPVSGQDSTHKRATPDPDSKDRALRLPTAVGSGKRQDDRANMRRKHS